MMYTVHWSEYDDLGIIPHKRGFNSYVEAIKFLDFLDLMFLAAGPSLRCGDRVILP